MVIMAVLVLLSLGGVGFFTLRRHGREADQRDSLAATASAGPKIYVSAALATPGERPVTLPGDVRAFNQATLFAKTNGFLKSIKVDKGDRVKADQVIAIIESPETDQQVTAAESDLSIHQRDAERARALGPAGVVSVQDLDRAEAALKSSQAGLARVRALQGYQLLRAPFAGIITQRYVDPGALVQAAVPVVDVADPDRLRVRVDVGQDVAAFLKIGDPVTLWQDERPELKIEAQITRMTSALDPRTRTMLAEIWLDNAKYGLYPGTFVHATLHLKVPPLPTVSADALFVRGDKTYVAVIKEGLAHFRHVEPGLNDGKTAQIRTGLNGDETVALNFPSELEDGARVQPVPMKAAVAAAPQPPSPPP